MKNQYDNCNLKNSNIPDKNFNKTQLKKGMSVEKEHSNNTYIQKDIAKAHLVENKNYYKNYNGKGKEYLMSSSKKGVYN
jgi:hypothetical protein